MISVLILTKNEEKNIAECVKSVAFTDDIFVFDSLSTDRTGELASQAGAHVITHRFENYGAQREAALRLCPFKYDWVLALDADERPDAELIAEITQIARSETDRAAFRMRRKDFFLGKWIRRSTLYPSWFVRFFRHAVVTYPPRSVHEYPEVRGEVGELRGHLLHNPLSKGLGEWWAKHARYAELEANEAAAARVEWRAFVGSDPVRRRRALKALSVRFPCRPTLRFLYMYILRGGLLDGYAGYEYCRLLSTYERLIVLNEREFRVRGRDSAERDVGN